MSMPDFSNPDVWMENIKVMKQMNLLSPITTDDGQPLCSDTLIKNFIRELDEEASAEMQYRLLSCGRVAPSFRIKMLTAMFHAINMVTGLQYAKTAGAKEIMSSYMFIISTLSPFDQILFTKKWDVPT